MDSIIDNKRWIMPEGIEELLPQQVARLEVLRREILDSYQLWGYQLVSTPMIEFIESLQPAGSKDLDSHTFKIIDSMSGRMLGLRADMTPQVARIDSRLMNTEQPVRLCYLDTVLRAYPDGLGGTREPLQLGAELYGHSGIESDIEVIELMLETIKLIGASHYALDLGHVGIYRGLAQQAGLNQQQETKLFDALQRKAIPEINELLNQWKINNKIHTMLSSLANLNGGVEVLDQARAILNSAGKSVKAALTELEEVAQQLMRRRPEVKLHFDLSELRGYDYQSGIVFAVFIQNYGYEVARGGRYDEIGKVFGRSRPATGFSIDLKILSNLVPEEKKSQEKKPIFAPCNVPDSDQQSHKESLQDMVLALRTMGEQVICELPGQEGDASSMGCDRVLVNEEGEWEIRPLNNRFNS
ncbi:ATP phosphoribosyltransferase regulatory subunit [hydrothermal vent metagenome]|uniref:ATP phosphoribosyltransferase regulatory subunit n=1 Tax=hydrothermal vent metagenome TaxID=652676 RepID=A0A3B0YGS6_9ZZZZ